MKQNKLVIKPGLEEQDLNKKLQKLSILLQLTLESFDRVACEKEVFNKTFKRDSNSLIKQIEKLNKSLFVAKYEDYQYHLNYASKTTETAVELLQNMDLDQINDFYGFIEVSNFDRQNKTKKVEEFLLEQTELINKTI